MPRPIHREKFPVARAVGNILADRANLDNPYRDYIILSKPELGKSSYQEGFDSSTVYIDELSHFQRAGIEVARGFLKSWYDR